MAKVALLIGVSEYEPGLNPLPAAENDVGAMQQVLLNPDIGGFSESDLTLLLNPDRQTMEEAIELLFASRQKDDLVLLYFSGHGIKDYAGKLYLASRKTRKSAGGDLILSTAVSSAFIQDNMNRSRSRRQVIILDSCFSGAFAEGLSAKDDCSVDVAAQLGGEGRAILTSSSSTQYSFEEQGERLSFYTRFLVDGIGTGAADQDEDGVVSIDELHEYASQKVREIRPEIKPEIYAIREGFKIHLTKVPPLSPKHRYRREVARFITRGELSLIGRRTLDVLRAQLRMDIADAKAIEDEVLEPLRAEFRAKLEQYEQVYTETLLHQETISDADREQLQQLQQILGLRNEDTRPIELAVATELKVYKQKLEEYEQLYTETIRQEYPLSEAKKVQLLQISQQLKLKASDLETLESRLNAAAETYHQNLAVFEQAFTRAVRRNYPLTEEKRSELKLLLQRLELTDVDIAPIEAKVTNEIQTYQQKLQQYEQAFVNATQRKYYPGQASKKQLLETWQTLELEEADVQRIETTILRQIEQHQESLSRYLQELTRSIAQQYPLQEAQRQQLQKRQAELHLTEEDVVQVEEQVIAEEEERLEKLRQYEEAFREAIAYEFPLNKTTLEELQRFKTILALQDSAVAAIEKRVTAELSGTAPEAKQNEPDKEAKSQQVPPVEIAEPQPDVVEATTIDATTIPPTASDQEEIAWQNACAANSSKRYKQFLQQYPHSAHASEIKERIEQLQTKTKEDIQEEFSWLEAKIANAPEAFARFRELYPNSKHLAEIETSSHQPDDSKNTEADVPLPEEVLSPEETMVSEPYPEAVSVGGETVIELEDYPEGRSWYGKHKWAVWTSILLLACTSILYFQYQLSPDLEPIVTGNEETPLHTSIEPERVVDPQELILDIGVYEGENQDRKPHGKGTLWYNNGDEYEGNFTNGLPAGKGKLTYKNCNSYEGMFLNGIPYGHGTLKYNNGDVYEGDFIKGLPAGNGTMRFKNGDIYKGELRNRLPAGKGNLTYINKDKYAGDFYNGKPHGHGTLQYNNGNVYKGSFIDGLPAGNGTMQYNNGDLYIGQFQDGIPAGKGKLTYQNGDAYEGNFLKGKPHGSGIKTYKNGDKIDGNFQNGSPDGILTLKKLDTSKEGIEHYLVRFIKDKKSVVGIKYKNNSVYKGMTDVDEGILIKHGEGILKLANGDSLKGKWNDDLLAEDTFHTYFYRDGGRYTGELLEQDGKFLKHGNGTMDSVSGGSLKGLWKQDKIVHQDTIKNDSSQ